MKKRNRKTRQRIADQVNVPGGIGGGTGLDDLNRYGRLNVVLDAIELLQQAGVDIDNDLVDVPTLRKLAERLEVPFLLLFMRFDGRIDAKDVDELQDYYDGIRAVA